MSHRLRRMIVAHLLPLVATACAAEQYAYVPSENATASLGGSPAADYAIPPNAPTGDARIASYGIAALQSSDGSTELNALHLRLSIANNSPSPWTLDTRDQRLHLDGRGASAPAFASADRSGTPPPVITIAPGSRRTVDLFFPLPADLQDAESLPAFDAIWRVNAGTQVVVERTPFERIALEEPPPYVYGYEYGYGGPFWPYGYWYYDPAFVGGWGVIVGGPYWYHPYVHGWGHPYFWRGGRYRGGYRGFHGGYHGGGYHGGGVHGGGHR